MRGRKPRKSTSERFWEKVDCSGDGCWEWQASVFPATGYGEFWLDGHVTNAHRAAYVLTYGSVPPGMCVCHRCDNRRCVRPDHLFLGTDLDNAQDKVLKGRASGGPRLTPEQREEIRRRYIPGKVSMYALAAEYGVGQKAIFYLVRGRRRAELPKAA